MDTELRRKTAVATLSVGSNATLVALKLIAGLVIGSVSVISEAIHSAVDLLAAGIALVAVRSAAKPPDEGHPFGHGKIENISGAVEALLIFVAAAWIVYEAIVKLQHPQPMHAPVWGVAVMLFSAAINLVVSQLLLKVGRETDSLALQADGWHLRTDVYTSVGVMAGLGVILLGGRFWPTVSLIWIDPVFAIAVALLITKAAYDLTRQATRDLLDARLPAEEEAWICETVKALAQVEAVRALRTRKAGPERFIEIELAVDPEMTVAVAHALTEQLERQIAERMPRAKVTIHVEPAAVGEGDGGEGDGGEGDGGEGDGGEGDG